MCEGGKEARNIKTWNFLIVLHILSSELHADELSLNTHAFVQPNILYLKLQTSMSTQNKN